MTGVLNAMIAGGGESVYNVTIGSFAGPSFGLNDSVPAGSISPSTFRGETIKVAASRAGNDDFTLTINGVYTQSFIQSVTVQRTDGALEIFRQQDVSSFISGPSTSIWQWGSGGSDPAWTATSPSPRAIIISF